MKDLADLLIELDKSNPSKEKEIIQAFLSLLKKRGLENQANLVLKKLENQLERENSKNTLYLKTVYLLDNKTIGKIKDLIKADKDSKVKTSVDKSLKAGFRVYWQGKIYDASLKNQLEKLKLKTLCLLKA